MEAKNSGLVKRNGPISHHAQRFEFSLIGLAMIFLPCGYVPAIKLILVADFPFGFRGVKSVSTDLKSFQVPVPDAGNSQVKGEQLYKCSVGTKATFLFHQSSSDIWYTVDTTEKS